MRASVWICILGLAAILSLAVSAPALVRGGLSKVPPLGTPSLKGCDAPVAWQSDWRPSIDGASSEVRATYRCNGQEVHVFVGQFVEHTQEAEAFSETQRVLPTVWTTYSTSVPTRVSAGLEVNEHRLIVNERELRIFSWFAVGDHHYRSRWTAKMAEVLDAVQLRSRPAAVLAVAVEGRSVQGPLAQQAVAVWEWYRGQLERQREGWL